MCEGYYMVPPWVVPALRGYYGGGVPGGPRPGAGVPGGPRQLVTDPYTSKVSPYNKSTTNLINTGSIRDQHANCECWQTIGH